MTLLVTASRPTNVIPAQAGTHASIDLALANTSSERRAYTAVMDVEPMPLSSKSSRSPGAMSTVVMTLPVITTMPAVIGRPGPAARLASQASAPSGSSVLPVPSGLPLRFSVPAMPSRSRPAGELDRRPDDDAAVPGVVGDQRQRLAGLVVGDADPRSARRPAITCGDGAAHALARVGLGLLRQVAAEAHGQLALDAHVDVVGLADGGRRRGGCARRRSGRRTGGRCPSAAA